MLQKLCCILLTLSVCFVGCSNQQNAPSACQKELSAANTDILTDSSLLNAEKESASSEIDITQVSEMIQRKLPEILSPDQINEIQKRMINDIFTVYMLDQQYYLATLSDSIFVAQKFFLYDKQKDSLELLPDSPHNQNFDSVSLLDGEIYFHCSGQNILSATVFPYDIVYNINQKTWTKSPIPLRHISSPYRVGNELLHSPSYELCNMEVDSNTLRLTLSSKEYLECSFPNCIFNLDDSVYQFWIGNLQMPTTDFPVDSEIPGIEKLHLEKYQLKEHSGTLLELTVKDGYDVFCSLDSITDDIDITYYLFEISTEPSLS